MTNLSAVLPRRWRARLAMLPAMLALAFLAACTSSPRHGGQYGFGVRETISESFRSGGHAIPVDVMKADARGPRPAVVMLHGASGIGNGYMLYPHGGAIAERGIHVFVVDYYAGLGSVSNRSSPGLFAEREKIISDAIAYVRGRKDVDPAKVGVFGLSLGGFHALSLAAQDPSIAAVVDLMGAMPQNISLDDIVRMPPTLILHGSSDRVVTPRRMAAVAAMLDRTGTPYEVKLYIGEGHTLGADAHYDSVLRTANFFDRYLNGTLLASAVRFRR